MQQYRQHYIGRHPKIYLYQHTVEQGKAKRETAGPLGIVKMWHGGDLEDKDKEAGGGTTIELQLQVYPEASKGSVHRSVILLNSSSKLRVYIKTTNTGFPVFG